MGRVLVAVVVAAALVCAAVEWGLPVAVERGMAAALAGAAGDGGTAPPAIAVDVGTRPALRLITGDIGDMTVTSGGAGAAAGLAVAAVATKLQGVRFDVAALLSERRASLTRSRDMTSTLTIDEAALNDFLKRAPGGLSDAAVRLGPGTAEVSGYLNVNGRSFRVKATGRLSPLGVSQVAFAIQDITVDDVPFGPQVTSKLVEMLGGPAPWFDLARLPVPLGVQSVACAAGRLTIVGTTAPVQR
jgi:hypothetical protein